MSSMDELYNRVQEKVKTAKTQLEKTVNPTKKTVSKYSDTVSYLYRQEAESMKGSAAQLRSISGSCTVRRCYMP